MTLTLVTGPANSAKAGEVFGTYAAQVGRGAVLVVPTASDVDHYARELAGDGVVLGSVVTFDGLFSTIARRCGYAGRPLSPLQIHQLLSEIIADLGLDALRASARQAGFVTAAAELIAELQRSLVTAGRLVAALRAWAAQDVRRAPFSRDVGRIYTAYLAALERHGRVDRERFATEAVDALRAEGRAATRWGRDAVFVYGFDDLSSLEQDAIQTLAAIDGVSVTVSLTYEPGRAALVARAESVEQLRPSADRVIALEALDSHYAPESRRVLHALERRLFETDEPAVDDPGEVVVLMEAGGERAEAELVCAEVGALLAGGMAADQIAVVHRSPATAGPLLERVFAAAAVPLAGRRTVPLGHTTLGRAVLGAARCAWLPEQAGPDDLLAYLRAPGAVRSVDVVDDLEATVRRAGLTTATAARAALDWTLGELDSLAAAAADPADELIRLATRVLAAGHRGTAALLSGEEELDARALAVLVGALDELRELGGSLPRSGRVAAVGAPAAQRLIELLAAQPVGADSRRPSAAAVTLAHPAEIRARRFGAVFVCGLQEGQFPAGAPSEPFFSDERRFELAAASGLRLRPREDALDGERYLFYAAVSRATERVFLAYRSCDEEGNLALASPFIADVEAVLGADWRARRRRRLLADVVWPVDQAPTARERARAQAAARAPLTGDEVAGERWLGAEALGHVRHARVVSAGALERYATCPVRWLIESELAPQPLAPEPEPLARGALIHDVLDRVIRRLEGPVTPAALGRADALLSEAIDQLAGKDGDAAALGAGRSAAVRAAALVSIEADLRRYLRHEAATGVDWRPAALERRFGFDDDPDSLGPLVLGEGEEAITVRGVVDRVDVDGAGHAIVRDYKSGARQDGWPVARWSQDRNLQIALYMLVVRQLAGLDPIAGVYQPLRGETLQARGVTSAELDLGPGFAPRDARSPQEIDEALDDAARRAVALGARLRAGELLPCPQTCSRDGCAYPAICRSQ